MAILDVKRLELAKSQLTTEQIFKIKREKFKIKNEIIEIKNTEKPEKESELKLNTREDIDQLIGQLVNAKKLTPEEWFIIVRLNSEKFQNVIFEPKLSFLRKNHKNDNFLDVYQFTLNIFPTFYENSHYQKGDFPGKKP